MANDYFEFKQFKIQQDKCAMKVGIDGVLLGAWVNAGGNIKILDIGTGTGLIALMLAQRTLGKIDAVEIDEKAAKQAVENFRASCWNNRINCFPGSLQDFAGKAKRNYDLIVSNPPYFSGNFKPVDNNRTLARHSVALTLRELVKISSDLLATEGLLAIVLPYQLRSRFIEYIAVNGLWVTKECKVRPVPNEPFVRIVFEASKIMPDQTIFEELVIEDNGRHKYSDYFRELTKSYYLY